jgi:hypothetical protein
MVRKNTVNSPDIRDIKAKTAVMKADAEDYWHNYYYVEDYLRTTLNKKQLKKESMNWLKKKHPSKAKKFSSLEEWRFLVFGKLCFIMNNGGELTKEGMNFIQNALCAFEEVSKEKKSQSKGVGKKSNNYTIQDYLRFKAQAVAAERFDSEIDAMIEDPTYKPSCDPLAVMYEEELSQGHARYILSMYEREAEELSTVLGKGADKELKEAYSGYTRPQLKTICKFHEDIRKAAEMVIKKSVTTRRARKPKKIDVHKKIEKLKYLKEFSELGLVSESPVSVYGAKEVWVYNTKTRKIGKYVAMDDAGIIVSGTTLKNISADKSVQKTLRNPDKQIKDFVGGGTRKLNSSFKSIKAVEIKLKGRMNDHAVILAVFK